jgi:hypothetical protein
VVAVELKAVLSEALAVFDLPRPLKRLVLELAAVPPVDVAVFPRMPVD